MLTPTPLPYRATRQNGVRLAGDGIDVVVEAHHASSVDFCLISQPHTTEQNEVRVPLFGPLAGMWHAHIPGPGPGQRYGIRAHGPWEPEAGHFYNPNKLLLDPYAQLLDGSPRLSPALHAHRVDEQLAPVGPSWLPSDLDSAGHMAFGVVAGPDSFDWGNSQRPDVPWHLTVVYEAHVRGLTKLMSQIEPELQGTYAGLAHPATIDYLLSLGVTSIELLPIHTSMTEPHLTGLGLTNYWGYSTLNFFFPNPSYATTQAQAEGPEAVVREVKGMIRLLHEAGLEVILDVVYNHTCEFGLAGPTVSWRGLDNLAWYLHDGSVPAQYADIDGCGNALDYRRRQPVALALESLRHWASQYQVDGFRYDLAVTLARGDGGFDPQHPFLAAVVADPLLRGLKHIAEPWDMGPGGWQTGGFPIPFSAWNDRFRDDVRSFWLAGPKELAAARPAGNARDLATRLSGSADLFAHRDPLGHFGPLGSLNYVVSHDGFTLRDLTTYEHKHNQANGEDNRDGTDNNRSWNHGLEGDGAATDHWEGAEAQLAGLAIGGDAIERLRQRSIRNIMATLLFSAGIPMICAGDEFGRSQRGNNNAYCQDNELSWVNWDFAPWQQDLKQTVAFLLALRQKHPALRPDAYQFGQETDHGLPDLGWFDLAGQPVSHDDWHQDTFRAVQMLRHQPEGDASDALVLINGSLDDVQAQLPPAKRGQQWQLIWDSTWQRPNQLEEPEVDDPANGPVSVYPLSLRLYLSGH